MMVLMAVGGDLSAECAARVVVVERTAVRKVMIFSVVIFWLPNYDTCIQH